MARDAPEVVIKTLLADEWDATNTGEVAYLVHHGWVDPDGDHLEVTISNPDESPIGGPSGYSGINQDGAPVQDFQGTVAVNVWASRDRTDQNPRKMAWLGRVEVGRILQANYDAPTTDLYPIADLGAQRFVEDADFPEDETVWRYQVTVGYAYRSAPA